MDPGHNFAKAWDVSQIIASGDILMYSPEMKRKTP